MPAAPNTYRSPICLSAYFKAVPARPETPLALFAACNEDA
jgi:hypothetical protein